MIVRVTYINARNTVSRNFFVPVLSRLKRGAGGCFLALERRVAAMGLFLDFLAKGLRFTVWVRCQLVKNRGRFCGRYWDFVICRMNAVLRVLFLLALFTFHNALAENSQERLFDAAPFGTLLQGEPGVMWEDPREIHTVIVEFAEAVPSNIKLRLEYWGSHWPKEHLPKDREPGGGDNGWIELGNWYKGGWRVADAEQAASGNSVRFTFRPVNGHEFPALKDYNSAGRFTLKIRVVGDGEIPRIVRIQALTDSKVTERAVRIVWKDPPVS